MGKRALCIGTYMLAGAAMLFPQNAPSFDDLKALENRTAQSITKTQKQGPGIKKFNQWSATDGDDLPYTATELSIQTPRFRADMLVKFYGNGNRRNVFSLKEFYFTSRRGGEGSGALYDSQIDSRFESELEKLATHFVYNGRLVEPSSNPAAFCQAATGALREIDGFFEQKY